MSKNGAEKVFSISDALMPLLDVTILLLGLIMILWTVQANDSQESEDTAQQLPSQVNLVSIKSNGTFLLDGTRMPEKLLKDRLRSSRDRLVLILIEDPWSPDCNEAYQQLKQMVQNLKLKYCLFSY